MVSVLCTVTKGDLPIGIKWVVNDKPVDLATGIVISRLNSRISQLSISSAQAVHAGNYTCAVKNHAGVNKQSALLHVNGTQTYLISACATY